MILFPAILIISNKFDFSTDLITYKLKEKKIDYLRLNRDQLEEYEIEFDPMIPRISVKIETLEYQIVENKLIMRIKG